MDKIVEKFAIRAEEVHFYHLKSYDEIVENDYNLSVSTYIEAENTRKKSRCSYMDEREKLK